MRTYLLLYSLSDVVKVACHSPSIPCNTTVCSIVLGGERTASSGLIVTPLELHALFGVRVRVRRG